MATALWLLAAAFLSAIHAAMVLGLSESSEGLLADAAVGHAAVPVLIATIWALSGSERRNLASFAKAACIVAGLSTVGTLGSQMGRLSDSPATRAPFTSLPGGFSVTAPVRLTEKVEALDLEDGTVVQMHTFAGEKRGIAYIASYVDYPASLVEASNLEAMLDGAVEGQASQPGSRLVSADPIQLDEHPGRAVLLEADSHGGKFTLRARSYMVGNRLYQVIVVQKRGTPEAATTKEFFSSFKLTEGARNMRPGYGRVAR